MIHDVTIAETPRGWLWKEHGRYYKTASGAQRAARRYSRQRAETRGFDILRITWEPSTWMGRLIAKALAEG